MPKQEARSKKQEARSKKQEAKSKLSGFWATLKPFLSSQSAVTFFVAVAAVFAFGNLGLSFDLANDQVRHWVGHARQDEAAVLFFTAKARPRDTVCHFTFKQLANTGSASSVAAGADQLQAWCFRLVCKPQSLL